MKVFKFGGASVKNAGAVKNLGNILRHSGNNIVVVVSAIDKTTNALELLYQYHKSGHPAMMDQFRKIAGFHQDLCRELFDNPTLKEAGFLKNWFSEIESILLNPPSEYSDFGYDRLVSYGELISSSIIAEYLTSIGFPARFLDIRKVIRTDNTYREARIDWETSATLAASHFSEKQQHFVVTQGFIGSTSEGLSTTLGREGSDFTAAILAYLLNAESVSIWKDVPGIMNADPAWYPNPEKIDFLSYQEAIELTFYGAKVIHPRTVKPLENKRIPLYVKSFVTPETEGTCIAHSDKHISYPPIYILKHNQVLLSISPKDFSFIAEDHISHFFALLNKHRTHVNLIQNSAISFSACADTNSETFSRLIGDLQKKFTVRYNDKLTLITIRHYNEEAVMKMTKDRSILLEQRSRNTVRYIVKESL